MTTLEALKLTFNTPINSNCALNHAGLHPTGLASPDKPDRIRIIWDDPSQTHSILYTHDQMMLAAINLTDAD